MSEHEIFIVGKQCKFGARISRETHSRRLHLRPGRRAPSPVRKSRGIRGRFSNGLSLLGFAIGERDKVSVWARGGSFRYNKLDVTRTHLHKGYMCVGSFFFFSFGYFIFYFFSLLRDRTSYLSINTLTYIYIYIHSFTVNPLVLHSIFFDCEMSFPSRYYYNEFLNKFIKQIYTRIKYLVKYLTVSGELAKYRYSSYVTIFWNT